jgi:hypothetical protein
LTSDSTLWGKRPLFGSKYFSRLEERVTVRSLARVVRSSRIGDELLACLANLVTIDVPGGGPKSQDANPKRRSGELIAVDFAGVAA